MRDTCSFRSRPVNPLVIGLIYIEKKVYNSEKTLTWLICLYKIVFSCTIAKVVGPKRKPRKGIRFLEIVSKKMEDRNREKK